MSDSYQPPPPPGNSPPPGYGPSSSGGASARLPWDDRESLGFATALVETIKLIATEPREAFSRIRADGDYVGPFLFALIIGWVMAVVSQMWSLMFSSIFSLGSMGLGDLEGFGFATGVSLAQVLMTLVLYPFILVIATFIITGICHLCLMMVGALEQSELSFEGTFKVICYCQVSSLANIVPVLGGLINLAVALVLLVIGFERAHNTSTGQAAAGALIPFGICCVCGIAVAFFFGAALAAAIAGAGVG